MRKYIETKKKPFLYKVIRAMVSVCYKKRKFIGQENMPDEPALYIGNHTQLHGPVTCELDFPAKKYIWCTGQMMNFKEIPAYAFVDFWSHKPKKVQWIYKILSYLIAPTSYLFNRADTIGVYKEDSRIINTYKNTIRGLSEGANIVIFPECPTEYNDIVNEFQDKFIDVARLYYKKYGKCISFVPMYNAVKLKTVVLGKPIQYNPDVPIEEQRAYICNYIKEEITRMAKELPRHKVVPYLNVNKKEYKFSK